LQKKIPKELITIKEKDGEGKIISRKRKNIPANPNFKKHSRKLRLDDALKQANFDGWSEARIRAYNMKDQNPNAYYYRFNDPGEPQKNGKWDEDEVKLFYERMAEVGVNGQWGVFSTKIPGRVGYQCSNFYRQLIESSQIIDENYQLDEKGKAHFIFKGKRVNPKKRVHEDEEKLLSGIIITQAKKKVKAEKKKKIRFSFRPKKKRAKTII